MTNSSNIERINAANANPLQSIDWGGAQVYGTSTAPSTVTYSFASAGTSTTFLEGISIGSYTAEGFNAFERGQFRAAFDLIENVTNLTFAESANYAGSDLRLMLDTNEFPSPFALGIMVPPDELGEGIGVFNGNAWSRTAGGSLEEGGFSFTTIVHELLHGLGLAHPHDVGGGSSVLNGVNDPFDDYGDFDLNQGVYTALSYNGGLQVAGDVGARSTAFGYGAGPMALDIALLQQKYGVNETFAAGDNVYMLPTSNGEGTAWRSIWDADGVDEIQYDGSRDVTIDLRAATLQSETGGGGFLSAADGIQGGFTIANGVLIEGARGGSGRDSLIGNSAANSLAGGAGNDKIKGAGGDDMLFGEAGNDTISGNKGNDLLILGDGNDRGVGQAGDDELQGGNGNDVLNGGGGEDTLDGGNDNDFVKGGGSNDILDGGAQDDRIYGNRHNDVLNGGLGDDLLNGGGNNDTLNGGAGDDFLKGGAGQEIIDAFGEIRYGTLILDFGGGDALALNGTNEPDFSDLATQIDIF